MSLKARDMKPLQRSLLYNAGSDCTCHQSHLRMERKDAHLLCLRLREQDLFGQVPTKVLLGVPHPLENPPI